MPNGERINVLNPSGKLVSIPKSQWEGARTQGYRLPPSTVKPPAPALTFPGGFAVGKGVPPEPSTGMGVFRGIAPMAAGMTAGAATSPLGPLVSVPAGAAAYAGTKGLVSPEEVKKHPYMTAAESLLAPLGVKGAQPGMAARAGLTFRALEALAGGKTVAHEPALKVAEEMLALRDRVGAAVPKVIEKFVEITKSGLKPIEGKPGEFIDTAAPLTYKQAREFLQEVGEKINWEQVGGKMRGLGKKFYGKLQTSVKEALPAGLRAHYTRALRQYSTASVLQRREPGHLLGAAAGYEAGREIGHPIYGMLVGGAAGGYMGPRIARFILSRKGLIGTKEAAQLERLIAEEGAASAAR